MYNLDQLLSYLVFITVITFVFERIIENLLIPFFPILEAKRARGRPRQSPYPDLLDQWKTEDTGRWIIPRLTFFAKTPPLRPQAKARVLHKIDLFTVDSVKAFP